MTGPSSIAGLIEQYTDRTPLSQYEVGRDVQVRAVSALIRMDAVDLLPMLFGPTGRVRARRGVGT